MNERILIIDDDAVVQDVARADLLGHRAALLAGLAQDPLGFEDARARLLGIRVRVPLDELVSAAIGDDDAAHARVLL